MTSDIHTLTGAYALDALDAEEREQFARHLRECPACAQEVAELSATSARLAGALAASPPPTLRRRVFDEVARTRQKPPLADEPRTGGHRPARPPRRWTRALLGLAAGVLLLAGVGLGAVYLDQRSRLDAAERQIAALTEAQRQAQAVTEVLTAPGRRERTAPVASGGQASLVTTGRQAAFVASDLPKLAPERTYQLWLVQGTRVRSAGLLAPQDGRAVVLLDALGPRTSVAVSVEPAGGSEQPTTTPLVVLPPA